MKHIDWKKIIPYVVAVVAFLAIAMMYCAPVFDGKVLQAGDVNNWKGAAQESLEYLHQTGETSWWTNSMFSGMPTYQITGRMPSSNWFIRLHDIADFGWVDNYRPIGMLFAYFFGFFLMLLCFGVSPWISLVGGLAIGLSSYFFLIIPAGHMTKVDAIGFLAPVIGGIYAIFRKRYALGVPLVLLYGMAAITLHPQMTYYVCMLLGIMAIAELYIHISEKRWKDLGVAVAIIAGCFILIFATKLSWWQMNQSYLQETMRGGHSELSQTAEDAAKPVGLDIDYATAWSYGKAETLTLLIPNYMGGASGYDLGKESLLEKELKGMRVPARQAKGFCQSAPTYWGEKAFTSGPVYVGAIICFLFVLGLIIVPGAYKWALLAATLFSILLAWGRNFMPLTQFFYDYFPMYNKFRAVESILVVAEITIPLLGFLALKQLTTNKERSYTKPILIAAAVTGAICLIVGLFGGSFDVTSSYDAQWKGQVGQQIYDAILNQRHALMRSSAWRSLFFVLLGAGTVLGYSLLSKKKQVHPALFSGVLGALILLDMVPVDRQFFGAKNFVTAKEDARAFAMQPWEAQILQDTTLDYRVLNLAANTFNDARTSYRLKSIGGYSAAKLRRYQDLIDAHISRNNWNVLNMLNTKYIVMRDGQVYTNDQAFGNAWLVDSVRLVATPDEESEALWKTDLLHVAVADEMFANALDVNSLEAAVLPSLDKDEIVMTSYAPNELQYMVRTERNRVAVFSEIFYKEGWHLLVDEVEQPIARVDYVLRATVIPAGEHQVRMYFEPQALKMDQWCVACIILAILISLALMGYGLYRRLR